jgi:hypothetical protein
MPTMEPTTSGPTDPDSATPADNVERRSGMLVVISAAVLVFVAVALALVAFLVHQSASDMQAEADRIERVAKQHSAATATASRDLIALQGAADQTYTTLGVLIAAYQAQLASQNHAIDVANGAAASYNSGQANIADALKTEAQVAVADADAKTAAVHAALVEVTQAFAALQQAAG